MKVEYEIGAGFADPRNPDREERAVALAKRADLVVLCLGTNLRVEAEGRDRRDLNLPGAQEQLLEAVYAANPKTVLVLMNAGPLAVGGRTIICQPSWRRGIRAKSAADAVARVLFGIDNPGGRVPYTVYANLDGVPPQNEYDVSKGYTYQYFKGVPLYPFGHGLSYTRFSYSNLKVTPSAPGPKGEAEISFDLRNAGDLAGSEVAQLYTHQEKSVTYQPIKSLRAFQRVALQPGETKTLRFRLPIQTTRVLRREDPRFRC